MPTVDSESMELFLIDEKQMDVSILLRENGKKELSVDHSPVLKFSEHIGKIPLVFIAPDDTKLITGASEERRSFVDTLDCSIRP